MPSVSQPVIRIVIAEDQAPVRRCEALLLSMEPDMEVVGQARNGIEAVALFKALRPDIILMDLHMPIKGGIAATREVTRELPTCQVLVLTTLDDDESAFEAVRAGAHAYLLKDVDDAELLDTIRGLRRGESRLTPQIARKVMAQFRRLAATAESPTTHTAAPEPAPIEKHGPTGSEPLEEMEDKILQLISEGMSNRHIAGALSLEEGTVKNYVSRILDKLHANSRAELALISNQTPRP